MANKFDKELNAAIDDVLKDYKMHMVDAFGFAYECAAHDIKVQALSVLAQYYREWSPDDYDRTYYLWHAIVPYQTPLTYKVNSKSTRLIGAVGVEYDSSRLMNHYYSNSKLHSNYNMSWAGGGQVEEEWILNNYLDGIHPDGKMHDANDIPGITKGDSPTQKMNSFLENYYKTFDSNVLMYFIDKVGNKI